MTIELITELTVFLENRPGTLEQIADALGEHDVSIHGINLTNALDHGALRLVVDDPRTTTHVLEEHNMLVLEHEVLAIPMRNEAGILHRVSALLAAHGINIDYAYGSVTGGAETATMYMRVPDAKKARDVLARLPDSGIG